MQAEDIAHLREELRVYKTKELDKKVQNLMSSQTGAITQRKKMGTSIHEPSQVDQSYLDKVSLEARLASEKNKNLELEQKLSFYNGIQRDLSSNVYRSQNNIQDLKVT